MKPREAAIRYIEAKGNMTRCLQENFKQLCTACKHYRSSGCKIYNAYVQAWIDLQESIK